MKTSPNHSIEVSVDSSFNDQQSEPERQQFVFSYTVRLHNTGSVGARLMSRHWVITDGNGKVEEVRGDGVVGQQPHIEPGQAFEYSSGAVLETDAGFMFGSYQMQADDGTRFDAEIPPFTLVVPRVLH